MPTSSGFKKRNELRKHNSKPKNNGKTGRVDATKARNCRR